MVSPPLPGATLALLTARGFDCEDSLLYLLPFSLSLSPSLLSSSVVFCCVRWTFCTVCRTDGSFHVSVRVESSPSASLPVSSFTSRICLTGAPLWLPSIHYHLKRWIDSDWWLCWCQLTREYLQVSLTECPKWLIRGAWYPHKKSTETISDSISGLNQERPAYFKYSVITLFFYVAHLHNENSKRIATKR